MLAAQDDSMCMWFPRCTKRIKSASGVQKCKRVTQECDAWCCAQDRMLAMMSKVAQKHPGAGVEDDDGPVYDTKTAAKEWRIQVGGGS